MRQHNANRRVCSPMPARAGVGLKPQHFHDIADDPRSVSWFEVHPENYMCAGGPPHAWLTRFREDYPLSLHGVGLSLGSASGLDPAHLSRLKALVKRYEPELVSEHVSWSAVGDQFLTDLLPLPYTEEALDVLARNVDHMQTALGRQVLVENPSTYLQFSHSTLSEPEFLTALVERAGCGLLLDINNVYVSACNHGFDAGTYLASIPAGAVGEIHLAGHAVDRGRGVEMRIDDHGSKVCDTVWHLYEDFVGTHGARPTLIEWDSHIPDYQVLAGEAIKADTILAGCLGADHVDAA